VTIRPVPAEAQRERGDLELADEELMARCRAGDRQAMDLLVTRYYQRLHGFAYRLLPDREAAADIAQETLLRAYRSAARFQTGQRFSTWLLTIAANLCRTELRRRSRHPEHGWQELADQEAPGSVEGAALQRLEGEEVHRALSLLSPEHRLTVVLFYFEQMSHQEIAQVCGCAVGTAKSRLHYALARLRALLPDPSSRGRTTPRNGGKP
jgi:RNA polymerase sigma-70 factor, ECF subfamily